MTQENLVATLRISGFELQQLLFKKHSLIYLSAFSLCWYFLLRVAVFNISNFTAESSADWSVAAFNTFFSIGLFIFPLTCIIASADQTSLDRARGTLRFITLRASRDSVFFGRFLAHVVLHFLLVVATTIACALMALVHMGFDANIFSLVLIYGGNLLLTVLPFIALMALLSVMVESPRKATVLAGLIWSLAVLIINALAEYFPWISVVKILVPSMQFDELTELQGAAMFSIAYIPLLQTIIILVLGRFLMKRVVL